MGERENQWVPHTFWGWYWHWPHSHGYTNTHLLLLFPADTPALLQLPLLCHLSSSLLLHHVHPPFSRYQWIRWHRWLVGGGCWTRRWWRKGLLAAPIVVAAAVGHCKKRVANYIKEKHAIWQVTMQHMGLMSVVTCASLAFSHVAGDLFNIFRQLLKYSFQAACYGN